MNEFAKYHPLINFIYFTAVIVFSMIFVHPICLVTSLLCSAIYSIILNGKSVEIYCDVITAYVDFSTDKPCVQSRGRDCNCIFTERKSVDVGINTIRNCRGKYGCNGHLLVFVF